MLWQIILTAKPERPVAGKKSTPWWVYLVSVLGGVILLGVAVFILYKVCMLLITCHRKKGLET